MPRDMVHAAHHLTSDPQTLRDPDLDVVHLVVGAQRYAIEMLRYDRERRVADDTKAVDREAATLLGVAFTSTSARASLGKRPDCGSEQQCPPLATELLLPSRPDRI